MKRLTKKFESLIGRNRRYVVFNDLCSLMAITIRNQIDKKNWQEREDQYLKTLSKYNEKEIDTIVEIFALITLELEKEPRDVLGELYMSTETGSKELGQFFTPDHIADLSSEIVHDKTMMQKEINKNGHVKLIEPAVGSGVFTISYVKRMLLEGFNPQRQLYVHATDLDLTAVHMTYIQLSLLGIPATIIHGNSITLECWDVWKTPFYLMNYHLISNIKKDKASFTEEESGQLKII